MSKEQYLLLGVLAIVVATILLVRKWREPNHEDFWKSVVALLVGALIAHFIF